MRTGRHRYLHLTCPKKVIQVYIFINNNNAANKNTTIIIPIIKILYNNTNINNNNNNYYINTHGIHGTGMFYLHENP